MEEKDLKKKIGTLGLYLLDEAQQEIKEINEQILFNKAEIKKDYDERKNRGYLKIRNEYIKSYNQFLNNYIISTLLESKKKFLSFKNQLIDNLNKYLSTLIKEKIDSNYSKYIEYLLNELKKVSSFVDKPYEIIIFFNPKDFSYFNKNIDKIKSFFKNQIELKQATNEFIGGFKITLKQAKISYDYSIDNLLEKNHNLIEENFSNLVSDYEYKRLETEFEQLIKQKKIDVEESLRKYDRI